MSLDYLVYGIGGIYLFGLLITPFPHWPTYFHLWGVLLAGVVGLFHGQVLAQQTPRSRRKVGQWLEDYAAYPVLTVTGAGGAVGEDVGCKPIPFLHSAVTIDTRLALVKPAPLGRWVNVAGTLHHRCPARPALRAAALGAGGFDEGRDQVGGIGGVMFSRIT